MLLTDEEGLTLTDSQWKGDFGHWMGFRILWDYGLFEDYQVGIEGTKGSITADLKVKGEHLVEVKNIDPNTVYKTEWLEDLKGELVKYEGAVEAGNAKELALFFCGPLGEKETAYLNDKLNEWFDDLSWLKICNGKGEFEEYAKLLAESWTET